MEPSDEPKVESIKILRDVEDGLATAALILTFDEGWGSEQYHDAIDRIWLRIMPDSAEGE